jgi:hypothetical protein
MAQLSSGFDSSETFSVFIRSANLGIPKLEDMTAQKQLLFVSKINFYPRKRESGFGLI